MDALSDRIKENLRRAIDAGSKLSGDLSKMTRADLETLLRGGDSTAASVRERVDDLIEEIRVRGRRSGEETFERLVGEIQREVASFAGRHRDDLAELVERATARLADLLAGAGASGRAPSAPPRTDGATETTQGPGPARAKSESSRSRTGGASPKAQGAPASTKSPKSKGGARGGKSERSDSSAARSRARPTGRPGSESQES